MIKAIKASSANPSLILVLLPTWIGGSISMKKMLVVAGEVLQELIKSDKLSWDQLIGVETEILFS